MWSVHALHNLIVSILKEKSTCAPILLGVSGALMYFKSVTIYISKLHNRACVNAKAKISTIL